VAYLVHIVRQKDYNDLQAKSNISLEEWMDYIKSDPELELTGGLILTLPVLLDSTDISYPEEERAGYCEWIGHPRADADTIPWFDFQYNSIIAKYPDNHTIGKMIKIASALNGKVRGDDGEYYDETFFSNGGYPLQE
jgi:hypothetical protein